MNRSQAEEHVSHDPPCCLDVDSQQATLLATDPRYLVVYQGGDDPQSWANNPDKKDKHWGDYRDPDAASAFFADFLKVWLPHCVEASPCSPCWLISQTVEAFAGGFLAGQWPCGHTAAAYHLVRMANIEARLA